MTQYVSVSKLLKALDSLKKLGNKYYQFVQETENFKEKCKTTDVEGFCFMYPEDELLPETNKICADNIETEYCICHCRILILIRMPIGQS